MYVLLSYSDLMISRVEVDLREVTCSVHTVHELFDFRQWVPVLHCDFVQRPIVNAHAPFPIFFWYKEDGSAIRA